LADVPSIESRLGRLDELLGQLDGIRDGGREAYDRAFGMRLATQHAVQPAIQGASTSRELWLPTSAAANRRPTRATSTF
jgi:hypothetical protein